MQMDSVGSTSWHHRHLSAFHKLDELLRADGATRPVIVLIGPGAVTRLTAPLLSDGARRAGPVRQIVADLARYADQIVRRVPWAALRSLEPVELRAVLSMPFELTVVDRSARVLEAVARDLPDARRLQRDIAAHPIMLAPTDASAVPFLADVVIAFNVICRSSDPPQAMRHVVDVIRPSGYLLVDDRSAASCLLEHPFEHVAPKIHRRRM